MKLQIIIVIFFLGLLPIFYLQLDQPPQSPERHRRVDNPTIQKGLGALTSSLHYIGGTIGNALEVGRSSDLILL